MKLAGKNALITGGNSGIGFATALAFIQEGANVAITGRDRKTLNEAVKALGPGATGHQVDLTDTLARHNLFAHLASEMCELDVLFVNAGISGKTPTGSTPEGAFEEIISINLTSAFHTVNSASKFLRDGASVIFNGSIANYAGWPGMAAYAASKGGLVSMARSIAADLAPRRIRVNVVAPGAVKTPIWKRGQRAKATPQEASQLEEFLSSMIPLERWGEAAEIAKAVLFLASDDSSYVNSIELLVDGGMTGSPMGSPRTRG